jgi:hypothetical protein
LATSSLIACVRHEESRCLGEQVNPLLHDIFDFGRRGGPMERLTAVEKRLKRDRAEKAKDVSREVDRQAVLWIKGSMLTDALSFEYV